MAEKLIKLANGVTIISDYRPGTGQVAMNIGIRAGALHDDPAAPGATFLAQEVIQTATQNKNRKQIAEFLGARGTGISSSSGHGSTWFASVALKDDAADIFDLMGEMLRKPKFDDQEILREKSDIIRALEQKEANPASALGEKFVAQAFKGQAVAKSPIGDVASIKALSKADIEAAYHNLLARPEDIVVSFSGDLDPASAQSMVEKHFADLVSTQGPRAQMSLQFVGGDYRQDFNNEQLSIAIGFKAPAREDAQALNYVLLQELVGGGMSSPLFQEIREKRGLVYGVQAGFMQQSGASLFQIQATTGKGKVGELIPAAIELLGDVAKNGFTQGEIDKAIERIERKLQAGGETVRASAMRNLNNYFIKGELPNNDLYIAMLKKVTPDDIRRAARDMLNDGEYALAGIGPQDNMPSSQDISAMMKAQTANLKLDPAPVRTMPLTAAFNAKASADENSANANVEVTVLANGLRIISLNRPGPLSAGAWVGAGSDCETPEENGITHMNEHMMFKGTKSYAPGTIDRIVEKELAGGLNAYTSYDRTAYYFYNLAKEGLAKTVDICGEMIFEASLSEEEFTGKMVGNVWKTGERDVVLEEIKQYLDKPASRQQYGTMAAAYPGQAAGRTILGTKESLLAMDANDLRAYRNVYYNSNNVVFAAVGPVDHKEFVKMVSDKYGHLKPSSIRPAEKPVYKGGLSSFETEKLPNVSFTLAAEGVHTTHKDSIAYQLLGAIAGGSETSRIKQRQLANPALAGKGIQVYAGAFDSAHRGLFMMGGISAADDLRTLTQEIYAGLRDVAKGATEAELELAKAKFKMGVVMGREQNQALCNNLATTLLLEGKVETVADIISAIDAVSVADIRRVARKVLRSNPTVSYALPLGTDPALIPTHDEIVAIRDGAGKPKKTQKPSGPSAPAP